VPELGLLLNMGAGEADGGRRGWWGQARMVGAGEANGGCKPPASCPSPPAPNTTLAKCILFSGRLKECLRGCGV